jgi:hypothetical protein
LFLFWWICDEHTKNNFRFEPHKLTCSAIIGVAEELLQKGYVLECVAAMDGCIKTYDFTRHPQIQIKILLRLAKILIKYTNNFDRAKEHLENAVNFFKFKIKSLKISTLVNLNL